MHGEAMGNEEIAATRLNLGWTSPPFEIPADIRAAWDMRDKGARVEAGVARPLRGVQERIPRVGRGAGAAHGRASCRTVSPIS